MSKYPGFGVVLEWDPAGGSSYSVIGQVKDIVPPGISRNAIDVTTHDDTDWWKTFIKGLKEGGELTFIVEYDPALASHDYSTGVLSDFDEDSTIPNWRVTFPDVSSTQWSFPGFLTSGALATPLDSDMTMAVTVKVSGKPTLA